MTYQTQAREFPALWASYINNNNINKVIQLYQNSSILIPTFSPNIIREQARLEDYFLQLASRKGLVVKLHENTVDTRKTGPSAFIITGIYSFLFEVEGTSLTFPSNFTFVVDLAEKQPIIHHHSSQVPSNVI